MADYGCDPLWWADGDKVGNIDPVRLPVSQETISHLRKWASAYNATLNWQDPANSLELSPEAEAAFEKEGISLWKQLQTELAPNYQVVYFSESLGKVLTDPDELEVLDAIGVEHDTKQTESKSSKTPRRLIANASLKRYQLRYFTPRRKLSGRNFSASK